MFLLLYIRPSICIIRFQVKVKQFLINKKVNGLNKMYSYTQQRISQQHSSLAADIRMLTLWGHRSKQAHVTHEIKYVQVAQSQQQQQSLLGCCDLESQQLKTTLNFLISSQEDTLYIFHKVRGMNWKLCAYAEIGVWEKLKILAQSINYSKHCFLTLTPISKCSLVVVVPPLQSSRR